VPLNKDTSLVNRFSVLLKTVICLTIGVVAVAQPTKAKPATKSGPSKESQRKKKPAKGQPASSVETVNPGVFLLRDPLVQTEMQLTPRQKSAAADLAAEFNESIWRFRDASFDSEVALKEARLVNARIERQLEELLNAGQRARLDGIVLQVQGTDALTFSATATKLSLTGEQQANISKLSAAAREAITKLRTQSASGKDLAELNREADRLTSGLQRDLLAVLTKSQRELWLELRGAPIDLTRLQPLTARAPELRGVEAWINSEPLSLEGVRGKVVALHFWTFG
jgi:hypothetical protein